MNTVANIARRFRRRTAAFAAIAQILLALFSAAEPAPVPVVGLLLSTNEPSHFPLRRAVEFAIERRQRLGLLPIRLQVRSGDGQWGSAADDTARLVFDDAAALLVAPPGGSITHLMLQVSGRTQVPVISLNGDGSVTGAGIPWMLRLVPSTRDQARCLLPLAKHWISVVPPNRDGRQIAKDLRETTRSLALPDPRVVVATPEFTESQLMEALAAPAEAMLLWLAAEQAAPWAKALRTRGYRGVLAGPCALRATRFTETAGSAAEGFLVARHQSLATPNVQGRDFDRDYRARFGVAPDELAWYAADAMHLAAAWLAATNVSTARDLGIGLTGPWQFAPAGDRLGALEIHRYHHGQWLRRPE